MQEQIMINIARSQSYMSEGEKDLDALPRLAAAKHS